MAHGNDAGERAGAFYASPADARQAPPEDVLYVACLHRGSGVEEPDFLAVVDANPASDTYSDVIHRTPMPNVGDELHHFGWSVCSSACHSKSPTSSPSWTRTRRRTPTPTSSTARRCRTSATSCTTSAGACARRPVTRRWAETR